jgi:DNA-binding transcriptional ArsR family regulator
VNDAASAAGFSPYSGGVTNTGAEIDIAHVAAAIGDPSRAKVLLALGGGDALPASALAAEAHVSNSTISSHLAKLRDAQLVTVELDGRHRYYRLATREVAEAVEHLARIARPLPPRSLSEDIRSNALLRSIAVSSISPTPAGRA